MKKTDKLIISAATFILLFTLSYVVAKNFVAATIIAFLLTVTIIVTATHLFRRFGKVKKVAISKIEDGLAFMGINEQTELFFSAAPECCRPEKRDNFLICLKDGVKIALFPDYKFAPCSKEDVARFHRICMENGISRCYVLSRANSRDLLLFARSLPVEFIFVNSAKIRDFLTKQNLVSSVVIPSKKRKKRPFKEALSAIAETIFKRDRAKYYLLTGVSLAFLAIFTPLKIYYAIFAALTLTFSLVCIIKNAV